MTKFQSMLKLILIIVSTTSICTAQHYNMGGFWKNRSLSTASFSSTFGQMVAGSQVNAYIDYSGCNSGTVQVPSAVSSNTPMTLAGSAIFYSDNTCTTPTTTVTINSGASSATIYFILTGPGTSFYLTASSPQHYAGTLRINATTGIDIWQGGASCDGQWTTTACWSTGAAPTTAQTAIFSNSLCSTNCSATLPGGTLTLAGLWLQSDYTGTVTQSTTVLNFSGGNSGTGGDLRVDGGTFQGGSANISLNASTMTSKSGGLYLMGGTFTSTSATLQLALATLHAEGNYTFNPNGGTFIVGSTTGSANRYFSVSGNDLVANNVTVQATSGSVLTFGGTKSIVANGAFTWGPFSPGGLVSGGSLYAKGDFTLALQSSGVGIGGTGSTTIYIAGSGTQTFTGTTSSTSKTYLPNLVFSNTGTVTASNYILMGGNWTNNNTGTVDLTTNTCSVIYTDGNFTFSGNNTFYSFTYSAGASQTWTFQAGKTQTFTNTLSLSGGTGTKTLTLASSSPGTAWNLVPPSGTTQGGHLAVSDSNSSVTIHTGSSSTLGSGNTNWVSP